jgi:hypothetical protein
VHVKDWTGFTFTTLRLLNEAIELYLSHLGFWTGVFAHITILMTNYFVSWLCRFFQDPRRRYRIKVVRIDDSHLSSQFYRDRRTNISSSHDLPESPERDPSGEYFQIIGIAKRLDIAQTRGHKSACKPPLKISIILCTIPAKFRTEF